MFSDLKKIGEQSPLIHNITNYVVMNTTANALLAIGASPVMAHAVEEVEQMASMSAALVVNVGTLSNHWVEAMEKAMLAARKVGVPIVYDPVGAGATDYRDKVNARLLSAVCPTIIRGNGSEIMALARNVVLSKTDHLAESVVNDIYSEIINGASSVANSESVVETVENTFNIEAIETCPIQSDSAVGYAKTKGIDSTSSSASVVEASKIESVNLPNIATETPKPQAVDLLNIVIDIPKTKGVDSTSSSTNAVEAAKKLSAHYGSVVVISGETDYIVSGNQVFENHYGTPLMTRVTGMGCTCSAICGAFVAINPENPVQAALNAMTLMGMAGERALKKTTSPGTFQAVFIDSLYAFANEN